MQHTEANNHDMSHKKIAIIGSGFSGLSAAAYAAQAGHEVHVYERHELPGGCARQFRTDSGYVFDMGPSWYWMPDIMEGFFQDFGYRSSDFFELINLNPQFEMVFEGDSLLVPSNLQELKTLFEHMEPGAGVQFDKFMASGKYKYEVGMKEFVNKPAHSWLEFISPKIAKSALKLDLLIDFRSYVGRYFKNKKLQTLMEFPVFFLGAPPKKIPALYSLMNYGGYALGTHYPMGGFHQLVLAMQQVAQDQGAIFHFQHTVDKINVHKGSVCSIIINGKEHTFDAVISSADYHHTESLLDCKYRNYADSYWEHKTFAPSSLIYYLGINETIPNLKHHTLFFEYELDENIDNIYGDRNWPDKPLFYACCPSKTDPTVAPEGKENLFLLMPLPIGIHDEEGVREEYLQQMLNRLERHTGATDLASKITFKRSYCVSDFMSDYSAYGGNAYGLTNTLSQTTVLKPMISNQHLDNLYYTGQLTVLGPGVPPSIISGKIVAQEVLKLKLKRYETTF